MSLRSKIFDMLPDGDLLKIEFVAFRETVKSFSKDKEFYVYALCETDGTPFYIGKGKGLRAWSHLFEYAANPHSASNKLKNHAIRIMIEEEQEYPIVHIYASDLDEDEAYDLERRLVSDFGRITRGGILTNLIPGGNLLNHNFEVSSVAGKIGGTKTRTQNLGIFSDDWDRSKETKERWAEGTINKSQFGNYEHCRRAGLKAKEKGVGIFAESYDRRKSSLNMWSSMSEEDYNKAKERNKKSSFLGGSRSKELGTNFTSWDKAKHKEVASKGGKAAGKIPMRTNGHENKRSYNCLGEGWHLGIRMRHKTTGEIIVRYKDKSLNQR